MSSQLNYEILVKSTGKAVYNDISYCAFIRCPMTKNATLTKIRLTMDQIDIQEVLEACAAHNFPEISIKIYSNERETKNRTKLMFETKLKCLNIIPDKPLDFKEIQMHASMELAHPILHTLGTDNSYNVIKNNITAFDVLKDFESHISKMHKVFDLTKSFNHIGIDNDKNSHLYEQILVKAKSDLDVPSYLLNTYKTHNTYCSYFFDNFHITKNNSQELVCHYMNLGDKEYFNKEDVKQYGDSAFLTKTLWERPLLDVHNILNKNNPVMNMGHQQIAFDETKNPGVGVPQKNKSQSRDNISLSDSGREIKNIEASGSIQTQEQNRQITSVKIITPDQMKTAQSRYNTSKDLFNNKVQSCCMFEITNALPDFPQFGRRYNLDVSDRTLFTHIPLNIVNVFMRQPSQRDPYLKLVNNVLTLKYK